MARSHTILRNTLSNIALQAISLGTAFVLLPLVIRHFGKNLYGINAYVAALCILMNFIGTSLSLSLMKYIPELLINKDYDEVNRLLSAVVPISVIAHLVLGLWIATFPIYGLDWFNVPESLQDTTTSVMRIVGGFTALSALAPVLNGILSGLELFHLRNAANLVHVAGTVAAYLYVVATNGSLATYVLIIQGGLFLTMIVNLGLVLRHLPFRPKWEQPHMRSKKHLWGYNVFLMANQIADHLMYTTDEIILQKFMGSGVVTNYHIARRSEQASSMFISLPLQAIIPSLSAAFASGDEAYVRRMNITGSFLYTLLVVPPLLAWLLVFDKFILVWIGPMYETTILGGALFLLTVIVATPFKVFSHCLVAKGRVKELGWTRIVSAGANLILSVILIRPLGVLGVILPTVLYWFCVHPILITYLMRSEGVVKSREFLYTMLPVLGMSVVQALVYILVLRRMQVSGWLSLGAMWCTVYALSIGLFVLLGRWICPGTAKDALDLLRSAIRKQVTA